MKKGTQYLNHVFKYQIESIWAIKASETDIELIWVFRILFESIWALKNSNTVKGLSNWVNLSNLRIKNRYWIYLSMYYLEYRYYLNQFEYGTRKLKYS